LDGYDHRAEECPNTDDIFTEDCREDHSARQEEAHQVEAHQAEVHQAEVHRVTDLQGPPSERTPEEKLWDFKTRAQQYARDRESCDDVRISYLEFLETEAEDDLTLARMIAG
jgi:antirestriction protein